MKIPVRSPILPLLLVLALAACAPAGPGMAPGTQQAAPTGATESAERRGAVPPTPEEVEATGPLDEVAPVPVRIVALEILEAAELPPTWEDDLAACWVRDVRLREEDTQSLQLRLVFSRRGVSLRTVQQDLPISESFRGCLEREVASWRLTRPPREEGDERVFPLEFVPGE